MSAETKQYQDKLLAVSREAEKRYEDDTPAPDYLDMQASRTWGDNLDTYVNMAVAAQVVRDLRNDLGDLGPENMAHRLDGYLYLWAEAHGVDVKGGGE